MSLDDTMPTLSPEGTEPAEHFSYFSSPCSSRSSYYPSMDRKKYGCTCGNSMWMIGFFLVIIIVLLLIPYFKKSKK